MHSNSQHKIKSSEPTEKLQKVLARVGLGSRRQIEEWIREGRIRVNQHIATIGERINLSDNILINGRKIRLPAQLPSLKILCYHKPAGEVCTRNDPEGRTTIFKQLPRPKEGRWISIGRLDLNTAGLLLLTTHGELAHRLMHPSYTIEREYAVRVLGEVDKETLKRLREGVQLDDGMAHFKQIISAGGNGANHWYHVTLTEGRNHEVKRLWESQGVVVSRLIRVRFGPIFLPKNLRGGNYVELDKQAEHNLLKLVNLNIPQQNTSIPRQRNNSIPRQRNTSIPQHPIKKRTTSKRRYR
ncbi:23S rRNA pseudouridine(2605) synthase RluB [Candidatus Parabeggiatoa sp. HSG14]|uniref:23S rRNA pseudouridine(2605) synthase RluB n=1 Tax=Candidatus Parabeggiatoa sp. HSG14 TaxID=3055593 RepID=UPI0025A78611|nr:pseudouridine synthase [Thiotrichales bacterium HSG14]